MSEVKKTVYKKLIEVQVALKAPKSQYNKFGKFYYRNAEDILEALKPILEEVGATIFITDKIVMIGNRFYVESTVTFIDVVTGESIANTGYAREDEDRKGMNSDQLTGATSSYARKYALNGMFAIDDSKDSDYTSGDQERAEAKAKVDKEKAEGMQKQKENKKGTTEEKKKKAINIIKKYLPEHQHLVTPFLISYAVNSIDECSIEQLTEIYNFLKGEAGNGGNK